MYKVLIEKRAERDLDALETSLRKRIIERLTDLGGNQRKGAKKLIDAGNAWRIRIGKLRVIYEIDDKRKEVRIFRIKHRSEAY